MLDSTAVKQSLNPQLNEWLVDKAHTALDLGLSEQSLSINTKLNFKDQQVCTRGGGHNKELVGGEGNRLLRETEDVKQPHTGSC